MNSDADDDVKPTDSTSQVASRYNARLLAEAEEAEALAQISLESIKLKAEEAEKLMALSQRAERCFSAALSAQGFQI